MSSQQVTITRKNAKKTQTKKEYYFPPELWRMIMAYVGTPEQYVNRYYSLYTHKLYPIRIMPKQLPSLEMIGIPITNQQYEDDGFKIQHANGLFYDIKPDLPQDMLERIRWDVGQRMPEFNRYCRRILKVLVKHYTHPTYINNESPTRTFLCKLVEGGDYIVVFSNITGK
jgi:hypothetical protein